MQATPKRRRDKGVALLITAASMFLVIPVVGLAIDAGFLYAVRAKLSAAADAAALASARSLSKGMTMAQQEASAIQRARDFFDANFPNDYLMTVNKQVSPSVAQTDARTRTVSVDAQVDVNLFFMPFVGRDVSTVRVTGTASRRDVNVILVLDRSGSMNTSNSCEPMKAAARQFIENFANTRDRIGIITYGMSYLEAFPPSLNFKPAADNVLQNITCTGGTGTAQALSKGYEAIQDIGEVGSQNVVVFFTDGLPTALTQSFPVKQAYDQRYGVNGLSFAPNTWQQYNNFRPSSCEDANGHTYNHNPYTGQNYNAPNVNPNWNPADKLGVMAAQGNATDETGNMYGITNREAISIDDHNLVRISDRAGCRFDGGAGNGYWYRAQADIAYLPAQDYYGNDLTGYLNVSRFPSGPYASEIRPDKPINIGRAGKNAANNVAATMRQDSNYQVLIYSIGLGSYDGSTTPPDADFMKRVANDPSHPDTNPDEPQGLYVYAPDKVELAKAFARVASEVLRLTR